MFPSKYFKNFGGSSCLPTVILIPPSLTSSSRIGFSNTYRIPVRALNLPPLHTAAVVGQYQEDSTTTLNTFRYNYNSIIEGIPLR